MPSTGRSARLAGIRARTTLFAAGAVATGLVIGAVVLVLVMRASLADEVAGAAELGAAEVADTLTGGGGRPLEALADADEGLVQIVNERGEVIESSPNVAGRPALADIAPGESAEVTPLTGAAPFVIVADSATTPAGRVTVLVGRSLDGVVEATDIVVGLLAAGLPILLGLVVLVTWTAVGRALAPVAAIRREVDAISATELHRRVPEPASSDEIGQLAGTMNRMLGRLEDSHTRQQRFVSDASHELRSPLAAIRQHAEVALSRPEATPTAELADTVLAEGLRMQRLVEDLLLLARADERTLNIRHVEVDLDDLVLDEARRLAATAGSARLDVSGVSAARVQGDSANLARLVRNLGENAVRHAESVVAFGLRVHGNDATLTVDDDGPGIPTADRERVLDRFVRLDEARGRDAGGSGLGLAIVAQLAAAHGGSVRVQESPLGGTRIEVRIPASPDGSAG